MESIKVLFVVSKDFGELVTIFAILQGSAFKNQTLVLLPPNLYQLNHDFLPGSTFCYNSLRDIVNIVKSNPMIRCVFLMSGYLFLLHELFSINDLSELVTLLQAQNCQIITEDPFLGLPSRFNSEYIDAVQNPSKQTVMKQLAASFDILKTSHHMYYTPTEHLELSNAIPHVTHIFNPNVIFSAETINKMTHNLCSNYKANPDKHRWLFILSTEDYLTFVRDNKTEEMVTLMLGILSLTQQAGRQPIFIGPSKLLDAISEKMESMRHNIKTIANLLVDLRLISYCSFSTFLMWLLDAEHTFYWNRVSASYYLRLLNQKSLFFLGKGHVSYVFEEIYDLFIQTYFHGHELGLITKFQLAIIEQMALEQNQLLRSIRDYYQQQAVTPDQLVNLTF